MSDPLKTDLTDDEFDEYVERVHQATEDLANGEMIRVVGAALSERINSCETREGRLLIAASFSANLLKIFTREEPTE